MDEFLQRICAEHGVTSASTSFFSVLKYERFTVTLHWTDGDTDHGCVSGDGENLEQALHAALAKMRPLRARAAA